MWRLKRDGAKKDEEGGGEKKTAKPEEKKSVSDHASEASTEALKRAAADKKAKPEVREAAKKELESRSEKGYGKHTIGKWHAADASSEDLERYIKDPKSDPELVKEAKKELDERNKKKKTMLSKEDGSKLMGKLMEAWELDSDHKFGERKKWEDKLVDTLNKMGRDMKWFNKNAEVIANANSGDYDDEVEELSDKVEGIDDLFNLVSEIGDDTENEPEEDDSEDVVDSSNIGEKIISALKSDQGGLNNTRAGKRAQNKIVSAAEDFLKRNPKVKLTDEDLEDIIGADVDYIEEKYGELRGWDKLNDAIEAYFDVDD